MSQRSCAVGTCGRPRYFTQEWCQSHYDRWKRYGDVRADVPFQRKQAQAAQCSLGCEKPPIARGWCSMHYNRWRDTGDPGPASPLYRKSDPAASHKECSVCEETKPKAEFYAERRYRDGRMPICKKCFNMQQRDRTLRRKYGIGADEYDALSAAQSGLCRICNNPPPPDQRGLVVDHCHTTGAVRGLLCNNCNALLGMAADEVARLRSAIDYLERSRE